MAFAQDSTTRMAGRRSRVASMPSRTPFVGLFLAVLIICRVLVLTGLLA